MDHPRCPPNLPREWNRFATAMPDTLRHLPLVDAYATLLFDADPTVRDYGAREWCAWEDAHVSLTPGHLPNPRYEDAEFRLRFARLVTHYWRHAAFLEEDQLLHNAARLNGIPGVLIHGRYDVSSPLDPAWQLSQRWRTCELQVLDDAGHGGGDTFVTAVVGALNRFAVTQPARAILRWQTDCAGWGVRVGALILRARSPNAEGPNRETR